MNEIDTPIDALVLTADQCAARLQIGRSTWYRMLAAGQAPRPCRLPVARWSRDEIEEWVAAGCPMRQEWERLRPRKK